MAWWWSQTAEIWNCFSIKVAVFRMSVNDMFTNTSQTQQEVLHSVTNSAFNVLNIMMGIGYINKWWPPIIRIIYTFLKLQLPECINPKQTWLHLPTNALHSPNFSEPTTDSLLLSGNCFTFMTADYIIIQSPLWFLPKTRINSSLLVYKQILMQAADNKCFMEDMIFVTS